MESLKFRLGEELSLLEAQLLREEINEMLEGIKQKPPRTNLFWLSGREICTPLPDGGLGMRVSSETLAVLPSFPEKAQFWLAWRKEEGGILDWLPGASLKITTFAGYKEEARCDFNPDTRLQRALDELNVYSSFVPIEESDWRKLKKYNGRVFLVLIFGKQENSDWIVYPSDLDWNVVTFCLKEGIESYRQIKLLGN